MLLPGDSLQPRIASFVGRKLPCHKVCRTLRHAHRVRLGLFVHVEFSVALPSGINYLLLPLMSHMARKSFTHPATQGCAWWRLCWLCSTWLWVCSRESRKTEHCAPVPGASAPGQVCSSCSGGFTKSQDLGKCLDGDSEPVFSQPLSSAAGPHPKV